MEGSCRGARRDQPAHFCFRRWRPRRLDPDHPQHIVRLQDRHDGVTVVGSLGPVGWCRPAHAGAAALKRRRAFSVQLKALKVISVKVRSEEHTSELQSLMRISYAVFGLKKKIDNLMQISIASSNDCSNDDNTY